MCGRFTLRTPNQILLEVFDVAEGPDFSLRYNIAPTQDIVTVRLRPEGDRELVMMHWGLVPFWAKDPSIGNRMINARSESVAEKPAFRQAFRKRRCLVAADGYYEWKKEGKKKQPYYIHRHDDAPFAFAGLWESWKGSDPPLQSATIITTDANEATRPVHDRMPVILRPDDYAQWLDPANADLDGLQSLLVPWEHDELQIDRVSTLVNNARHEDPACVERLEA